MTDAYDRQLRLAAWRVGRQLGFADFMREGISLILCGPNFETQAELRMIRALGADVVGRFCTGIIYDGYDSDVFIR